MASHQVLYSPPYLPSRIFGLIILLSSIFFYVYVQVRYSVGLIAISVIVCLAILINICMWAILFDPNVVYWTSKRVVEGTTGDEERGGDGDGDGERRVVHVKRPIIGYEDRRMDLETPEWMGNIWLDGYRHEQAIIRI